MPPKKKEEEIDIASLPQCRPINVIVLAKGKKARATRILQQIQKEAENYLFKVKKSEVLDHAKEKNIFIDPATLSDKQKKDQKYMESICTELTPEVLAKAVQSHLGALTIKARMEKKNNPGSFANDRRKYDVLYCFEDFPDSKDQYQELDKAGEGIKYVLVVEPKVTWASAPEGGDEEEEDEEVKEYKDLLQKEEPTQEDLEFQKEVSLKVESIRKFRRESSRSSQFRNCTISVLQQDFDPYNEETSLNETIKAFFDNIAKLDAEFAEFQEWKEGKQAEPLPAAPSLDSPKVQVQKGLIPSMLDDLARGIDKEQRSAVIQHDSQEEAVVELIQSFRAGKKKNSKGQQTMNKKQDITYMAANEERGLDRKLKEQLRRELKYPGVNRHQMPEVPTKSEGLRKQEQSHYANFLPSQMPLHQFFRRQRIFHFQEFIKEFDPERTYDFADRVFEEQHDAPSLQRELYKASENGEASVFSKYDPASDKLYVMLQYRNNGRRVSLKSWQGSWKVIPNFENWLKFFRNNEGNLCNSMFYDLDYQKIGNIEETCRAYTLKNGLTGAVIIDKECSAGNATQQLLYSLKDQLVFGVSGHRFYGQHQTVKVFHHRTQQSKDSFETVILLENGRVRLSSAGTVTLEQGEQQRQITPEGFTIIYGKESNLILHPTGGITSQGDTFVNERGLGLKKGHLFSSLALERTTGEGKIRKREDGTVIITKEGANPSKWIKFDEGTEYQITNDSIKIEKPGTPFAVCSGGSIQVVAGEVVIKVSPQDGVFQSRVQFKDGSLLTFVQSQVVVSQKGEEEKIKVSIDANQISSLFGDEEITVNEGSAHYRRKDKVVDAREDQEKYSEQDILPEDCLEPRLFVVNSDNTGVELLSDNMVKAYLAQHQSQIEKIHQVPKDSRVEVQILQKLDKPPQKHIRNELTIKLDVFDNSQPPPSPPQPKHITIRTLLKYPPLSPTDFAQIASTQSQVEAWRKANLKEENQFGHRGRDPEVVKQKIETKLLSIRTRQTSEPGVDAAAFREKGQALYEAALLERQKREEAKQKEEQLRRNYLRKKNSVIIDYKPIPVQEKKVAELKGEPEEPGPFLDHYFMTAEGRRALSEMPEWVFRPKDPKVPVELDPEIQDQLNNTRPNREEENSEEHRERYDTVEVNLNPRAEKEILIKPSVFTQREIDEERLAFEGEKKAYKYHEVKRKDFDVYGQERRSRPEVRTLQRTQAISQINQKYLVTEAPLDKKVKISSMKNKLTSGASSMVEMRKEGPHSLLMKTLDKGHDVNKLLEKRTMMVQADLNDKLQRDILITPVEANFGVLLERKTYQLQIVIKNEDIVSQRVTLKRPKSLHAKVSLNQMGPIAMGMTRKVMVTLRAAPELLGKFTDEFDLVTKHEIYHIPITAHVVSQAQVKNDSLSLSRGVVQLEDTFRPKGEGSIELPPLK